IVGELNDASVAMAQRELAASSAPRTLRIRSAGGRPEAAIRLADQLRTSDVTLVVDGYCLAACAQYLFMSAPRREVTEGSLVAFSNNVVAGAELLRTRGEPVPAPLAQAESVDRGVYERWRIPAQALIDQFSGLTPICVEWSDIRTAYGPRVQHKAQMWTPPRGWVLANSSQPLSGWWAGDQRDATAAFAAVTRDLPGLKTVRFGSPLEWKALESKLTTFPCRGVDEA
ncbi:unnamed protein product, partial [Phaeothamnion confervicola]